MIGGLWDLFLVCPFSHPAIVDVRLTWPISIEYMSVIHVRLMRGGRDAAAVWGFHEDVKQGQKTVLMAMDFSALLQPVPFI